MIFYKSSCFLCFLHCIPSRPRLIAVKSMPCIPIWETGWSWTRTHTSAAVEALWKSTRQISVGAAWKPWHLLCQAAFPLPVFKLVLWEFCTMGFGYIYPLPQLFPVLSLHTHTHTLHSWMRGFRWNMGSGVNFLTKNSTSPRSHDLIIAPQSTSLLQSRWVAKANAYLVSLKLLGFFFLFVSNFQ